MRITKEQLKRIIKEELEAVMEVGGSATSTGGYSSYTEPTRKPYLSMGRVEKALKKQLGREPSEEEVSTKYDELKATGKYKELGTGPLGRKNESAEDAGRDPYTGLVNHIRDNLDYIGEFSDMVLKNYLENEMEERGIENTEENFTALWNLTKNELNNTALNENNVTGLPIEDDVRELYSDGLDAASAAEHIANVYDYHEMERLKEKFEFAPWKGDLMARFNIFIQDVLAQMR